MLLLPMDITNINIPIHKANILVILHILAGLTIVIKMKNTLMFGLIRCGLMGIFPLI